MYTKSGDVHLSAQESRSRTSSQSVGIGNSTAAIGPEPHDEPHNLEEILAKVCLFAWKYCDSAFQKASESKIQENWQESSKRIVRLSTWARFRLIGHLL